MATICGKNVAYNYICNICDYYANKKYNYDKHLLTSKHQKNAICQPLATFSNQKYEKVANEWFECKACNKVYKDKTGLWRHNKKCLSKINDNLTNKEMLTKLIEQNMSLITQNQEFKDLIKEQNEKIVQLATQSGSNYNTISNSNINSNNSFNINMYLNETCKNALNINEFIDTLAVSLDDLEDTARLGYVEGISKIFIKGLNNIDAHNKPIHCSDLKREVLYIKNNDIWIKETDKKPILTNAIKTVAHKNLKQIAEWQKLNPEYLDPDSKQSDKYQNILFNVISGSTKEESENNHNKIVKNVAKKTLIDKLTN
jgi:hypothetical protein